MNIEAFKSVVSWWENTVYRSILSSYLLLQFIHTLFVEKNDILEHNFHSNYAAFNLNWRTAKNSTLTRECVRQFGCSCHELISIPPIYLLLFKLFLIKSTTNRLNAEAPQVTMILFLAVMLLVHYEWKCVCSLMGGALFMFSVDDAQCKYQLQRYKYTQW